MIAFGKNHAFFIIVCCGILVLCPYASPTPVDTPIEKDLTALLSGPSASSEVITDEENALAEKDLSYDALITSDTGDLTSNSNYEDDIYYNGTDVIDNLTYQQDASNDTGSEVACGESTGDELIYYFAGSSTIIVTVVFAVVFFVTIGCVAYRNILSLIP